MRVSALATDESIRDGPDKSRLDRETPVSALHHWHFSPSLRFADICTEINVSSNLIIVSTLSQRMEKRVVRVNSDPVVQCSLYFQSTLVLRNKSSSANFQFMTEMSPDEDSCLGTEKQCDWYNTASVL